MVNDLTSLCDALLGPPSQPTPTGPLNGPKIVAAAVDAMAAEMGQLRHLENVIGGFYIIPDDAPRRAASDRLREALAAWHERAKPLQNRLLQMNGRGEPLPARAMEFLNGCALAVGVAEDSLERILADQAAADAGEYIRLDAAEMKRLRDEFRRRRRGA